MEIKMKSHTGPQGLRGALHWAGVGVLSPVYRQTINIFVRPGRAKNWGLEDRTGNKGFYIILWRDKLTHRTASEWGHRWGSSKNRDCSMQFHMFSCHLGNLPELKLRELTTARVKLACWSCRVPREMAETAGKFVRKIENGRQEKAEEVSKIAEFSSNFL